jgi:hypothetical protein
MVQCAEEKSFSVFGNELEPLWHGYAPVSLSRHLLSPGLCVHFAKH